MVSLDLHDFRKFMYKGLLLCGEYKIDIDFVLPIH